MAPSVDIEDPTDLSQTGWGVIFSESTPNAVRQALNPLLEWRREQAGDRYIELTVPSGVSGTSFYRDFVPKTGRFHGWHNLPYYLLIVGSPTEISFRFQLELDVQFAVGRIYFSTPDSYSAYAQAVLDAEMGMVRIRSKLVLFSVKNPGDDVTHRMSELIAPLAESLTRSRPGYRTMIVESGNATRERLQQLLGGAETPAILFTASHGLGFPLGDPRQIQQQGALVCQEWPGPSEPVQGTHCFTAQDILPSANLRGTIVFLFASYSLGTPKNDEFMRGIGFPWQIAEEAFIARLPQVLLERRALAVIGHVDRVWTSSFSWNGEGGHVQVYSDLLKLLMDGLPIGWAMERMGVYYADHAATLHKLWEDRDFFRPHDFADYANLWKTTNDARGLAVFGDPAVRLDEA